MTRNPRFNSLLASVTCLVQVTMATDASAAPMRYRQGSGTAQSSLRTILPVPQLGKLTLPGGLAVIDGNAIDIQAVPEGLFDPRRVLSGVMIKSQGVPEKSPQAIKGLAYFFAGTWLNYISQAPLFELVEKTDGTRLTGQIEGGDEKSIILRKANGERATVEFCQIENIESPRAFSFLIPFARQDQIVNTVVQGDAKRISFQRNNGPQRVIADKRVTPSLMGDEQGITKGQISSYLLLDLFATIAPAIATPLVLQRANYLSAERLVNRFNAASAVSSSGSGNGGGK